MKLRRKIEHLTQGGLRIFDLMQQNNYFNDKENWITRVKFNLIIFELTNYINKDSKYFDEHH